MPTAPGAHTLQSMRRPSSLLRAVRAMTAVITVWCVGCTGFEPLLDAALGTGASVMTCEPSAAAASADHHQAAVAATAAGHQGFDCGCGSCHSVAPIMLAFQPVPHAAPAMTFDRPETLASVVRAPLLPPPQRAT